MKLSFKHMGEICKYGQDEACCRFLVCGAEGLSCAKHTSLKEHLDDRVQRGRMIARGDNCSGELDEP